MTAADPTRTFKSLIVFATGEGLLGRIDILPLLLVDSDSVYLRGVRDRHKENLNVTEPQVLISDGRESNNSIKASSKELGRNELVTAWGQRAKMARRRHGAERNAVGLT